LEVSFDRYIQEDFGVLTRNLRKHKEEKEMEKMAYGGDYQREHHHHHRD
jgi:hypothetical protein